MHILLTDILTCPACGPDRGLIVLTERIEERRVLEGRLGCPNCREQYPVRGGFADLRRLADGGAASPAPALAPGTEAQSFRLAALMGITRGPGYALIVGAGARLASGVAALIEHLEVVAVSGAAAAWTEMPGVSRLAAERRLPFFGGSMRAVALTPETAGVEVAEAARVLAPGGRLVWETAGSDAAERLEATGLRILARQADTVVAVRG